MDSFAAAERRWLVERKGLELLERTIALFINSPLCLPTLSGGARCRLAPHVSPSAFLAASSAVSRHASLSVQVSSVAAAVAPAGAGATLVALLGTADAIPCEQYSARR